VTDPVEEIIAACESMQGLPYDGEPVDQLEHALQCAGSPATLTEVSARTLIAQGGPMSDIEVAAFERQADWQLAVALRLITRGQPAASPGRGSTAAR
jgi:predicted HD phosphohydrolase